MRYASVCDGIGAVHCAWKPLGWECAWTSEIDKFPIAVVERHWGFPNLGDMTEIDREMLDEHGPIGLLVGGTPCQSFSVAGLRGGLDDDRGNLALRFMQLCAEARPTWVVWENVPGVFSVDGGRAFGSILGALEELGYGWAYRTLDAQWFGVAQRRRRVFVVGCLGDWRRAAAVLFEQQSVCGDPPTREAARQGTAADAGRGAQIASHDPACCLTAREHKGALPEADLSTVVAHTPDGGFASSDSFQGGSQQDQILGKDAVCPALCHSSNGNKGHHQPKVIVPYTKAKRAQSASDDETWKDGEVSPTLNHFDVGDTRSTTVVTEAFSIREDAKAKNFSATPTDVGLAVQAHQPSVQSHHAQIFVAQQAVGADCYNGAVTGDVAATHSTNSGNRGGGIGPQVISFAQNQLGEVRTNSEVMGTVNTNQNASGRNTPMVQQAMAVRRLTPRECERLQGFPDDYTLIPWRKKAAEDCPDGPRYRALGNSMAVPVMHWIGRRIQLVDEMASEETTPTTRESQ